MPDSTASITDTQRRILDAAIDVWNNDPPAILLGGLSVARVSKAAGVTRSTFYAYWPTSEAYILDLLRHLAARVQSAPPGQTVADLGERAPISPDMVDRFMLACAQLVEADSDDPAFMLRHALLSKADEPEFAELLREIYRSHEEHAMASFSASLHEWAREPRPPFTDASVLAVLTALLDGLSIRRSFDPDAVPIETFGRATLAFLMFATRTIDDDRELDALFDSVNNWPSLGLALRLRERTRPDADPVPSPGLSPREVVVAARRLLTRGNYTEFTFAEVAATTGISEHILQQWFGSKAGLGLAIYLLNVAERYDQIDPSLSAIDTLWEMIDINLTEVDHSPALAQAVLLLLAGATTMPRMPAIDWDPRHKMVDAIARAQHDGDLDPDLDPRQFSAILQRVMTVDRTPPGSHWSPDIDATAIFMAGAGAPPRNR